MDGEKGFDLEPLQQEQTEGEGEEEEDFTVQSWFGQRWSRIVQECEAKGTDPRELNRLESLFRVLEGKEEPRYDMPSIQLPYGFYLPRLPTRRFFLPECRAWRLCQTLKQRRSDIVYELLRLLPPDSNALLPPDFRDLHRDILNQRSDAQAADNTPFRPYVGEGDGEAADMVRDGSWDVFYFFRDFVRQEGNCSLCPTTSSLLDQLIADGDMLGGMVCFSALKPSTRILPHYGPSNMR